jgi:hypothetical protein
LENRFRKADDAPRSEKPSSGKENHEAEIGQGRGKACSKIKPQNSEAFAVLKNPKCNFDF